MPPTVRPYTPADLQACLALFDSNCPPFFDAGEKADYRAFLETEVESGDYFALEDAGGVVACGGCFVDPAGWGGLSWGMVRADLHGQGLGGLLTRHRLARLQALGPAEVRIDTSQHTTGFYARFGFVVVSRRPDGFAPGLDEVKMVLSFSPALS